MNIGRKMLGAALVAALAAGALPGAATAAPKQVWEDPAGDAFLGDPALGPLFAGGGFDITAGHIELVDDTLEFTVEHDAMPPFGSMPETFRFMWAFAVDDVSYRITAKTADIGKPDVAAGETTERVGQVDLQGHFRLEGDCGTEMAPAVVSFVNCHPLVYVEGTFDPGNASFTVVIPMEEVGAKPGSKITVGGGDAIGICSICWVSHLAERSSQATVIDNAAQTETFKVPGKKKKKKKKR